ncbi:MAG TPA: peptidylprolyl isomerase [Nitrospiria bacterium]|nr:peptidylprolyl isomerase [Nitrospiria bacterium]
MVKLTTSGSYPKRLLREPLIHFLLIGAVLFLVFRIGSGPKEPGPNEIMVSLGVIESLAQSWEKKWQRKPTVQELEGLIENYIREEVLYREALAMGLEKDDTIIKRRLGQKMTFLFEDVADLAEVTEEQLEQYLAENRDSYLIEPRYSFQHIYLNPDERGGEVHADAEKMLGLLRRSTSVDGPAVSGDPFLLGSDFRDVSEGEVGRTFGREFASGLLELETGQWSGPVRSGYGYHLILVQEKVVARFPELDEVREAVERDLVAWRRREANEKIYQRLRERYTVTIERLDVEGGKAFGGTSR